MHLCITPVLCLLLLVPLSARAAPPEVESRLRLLETVTVSEYLDPMRGRGLELTFKSLRPDPVLARFNLDEARAVVAALDEGFKAAKSNVGSPLLAKLPKGVVAAGAGFVPSANTHPRDLEKWLREQYEALYGPSLIALPAALESARWFQALTLSPRYMGEGVSEAAMEMFSSPTVLLSVGMSMMLYMVAWAAPEPLFSKAFAAAVTIGLLMTYTATELYNVGLACLNLYREAEAARTQAQLEVAARRFGMAIGGVGLRVLLTVAGAKLSRNLPEGPGGGLWAQLSPPRFAFPGGGPRGRGFSVRAGARAQVNVADGTVVLMGVSANTAAHAVTSAVASARTAGACRDASDKGDAKGHHLATNKNDKSDVCGGPWTPRFKRLFDKVGMSLDDPANIVYLVGHIGPHPEEYHQEVYRRLEDALKDCHSQPECKARLVDALDEIAGEVCSPGSRLNKLATRKP